MTRRQRRFTNTQVALAACAALCALLVPAVSAVAKRHKPAMVHCVGGFCETHFSVQISGSQNNSWSYPYQPAYSDCFHSNFGRGYGGQRTTFSGSGVVEVSGSPQTGASFEYLHNGVSLSGIGEGRATIDRTAHLMAYVKPGPCGTNKSVGTYDHAHGCGNRAERWAFGLGFDKGEVGLSADASVVPLTPNYDGCPILQTGIPTDSELQGLYDGFTEPLPASELFDPNLGKIILFSHHVYSNKPRTPLDVKGSTQIDWTISLTRIPHKSFPLRAYPLAR